SGIVTGEFAENDVVSFTVNGTDYSAVVDAERNWSVEVVGSDLAAQTEFVITATGTDDAGNPIEKTVVSTHIVDVIDGNIDITINKIAEDDILNAKEEGEEITVSGVVTGDYTSGDDVKVTVNGVVYKTTLDENGKWSVEVAGTNLAKDDKVHVEVLRTDSDNKTIVLGQEDKNYSVDLEGKGSVTVNNITENDIVTATEISGNKTIAVSGIVTGEFAENDVVSFTVNGTDYSAVVDAERNWSVEVVGSDLAAQT
ncbi:MAG: Ig-like domain-containing protein, partial [Candidatus Brocadiaceae bacterium]|nr:Ig-like domain-containing protein [Candidatus Brocadiaceae bacterium]